MYELIFGTSLFLLGIYFVKKDKEDDREDPYTLERNMEKYGAVIFGFILILVGIKKSFLG